MEVAEIRYLYSLQQRIVEYIYRNKSDCGHVYMFHQVENNSHLWSDARYSITAKSFAEFINRKVDEGAIFLDLSHISNSDNSRNTYITFDDIYKDIYQNAVPILEERNIPYCCFITVGLIDQNSFIERGMLQDLVCSDLCTIGAHTLSHLNLRKQNASVAAQEIIRSKAELEEMLGIPINDFAYPYGSLSSCSKRDICLTQRSGYKRAFSSYAMGLNKDYVDKNIWFLPRININESNSKGI